MIDSAVTKQVYLGDGSTTNFPIPFPFLSGDDVKCAIYDIEEEIETELTSDYYVDTVANKVVYPGYPPGEAPPQSEQPGPLPEGKKLVVYRSTPINQLEDLGDKYPLQIVESMTDKNTLILQEMNEITSRAVTVERGSGYTPQDVASDIRHLKEYRNEALDAAGNAASSAADSAASALEAAGYATASENSATASAASAAESAGYATASENSAAASAASAGSAANSAEDAAGSAANALTSANNAEASALQSATHAANSAASATISENYSAAAAASVGTVQASEAVVVANTAQVLTAATSAGASATAAQASAAAAALSAGTATTQAELASGYATSAAADAADAADSASAAADSASAAATSATEAEEANTEAKYYAKITMDKIAEAAVGYPHQEGTLTYDGTEQTPTWDVFYEPQKMTVTGTTAATNAGTYTITMTPKAGYYWWDTNTTTARTQTWTIGRQAIEDVPSQSGTLTYDGTEKTPTFADYDSTKMAIGGTTSATNAGTYTATFTPNSNYKWSDGTTTAKNVTWAIGTQSVSVPTVTDTAKTYNGAAQGPTIGTYDSTVIDVSGTSATNAGSYAVVFHLKNANYTWTDTTTADKSVSWTISPKSVTIPSVTNTSLTYTGSAQGPTIASFSATEISQSGTASATNAGSYTVTLSLTSTTNYKWSDNSTAAKSTAWSIAKMSLAVPTLSNTSKTYNRSSQAPTISAYDTTYISATGDLSATNAGNYTITFSLLDTDNTQWTDGTTAARTAAWSIAVRSITAPYLTNTSKTYNGSSQSPTQNGYSSTYITRTGTQSATNAGDYNITYTLKSTTNTQWSDGTTAAKVCPWTIAKAAGSMSLSKSTVSLDASTLTDTVTVTRSGDGTVSATSSDTSIATVSVSGTTVTITAVANGSATVTVSVAEGTNYLAPSSKTVSVACSLVDTVLNNNSWATISAVAQAGTGDNYWDVGDVKMITLNGAIGSQLTLTNYSIGVFILDFNHAMNGTAENNIIFGGFKTARTGGTDVCLCDAKYDNNSLDGTICFNMNHKGQDTGGQPGYRGTNYGGWKGSDLRYDILGATSTQPSEYNSLKTTSNVGYDATSATLTSPKADTFLAALPSDLRSKIRLWTRYIDAVGNSSNVDANVKATVDAVTLLCEPEIFTSQAYANQYEYSHNTRMAYYTAGNSTIKKKHSDGATAVTWWEASPNFSTASSFARVDNGGNATNYAARTVYGLAPAFKI